MKVIEIARFVDDVPKAVAFYGLLLKADPTYCDDALATFDCEGVVVLIHRRYLPGPGDLPCEDHIAFGVEDVDETVAALERQGLTVEFPPRDYDWGRSAYLREPAGRSSRSRGFHRTILLEGSQRGLRQTACRRNGAAEQVRSQKCPRLSPGHAL